MIAILCSGMSLGHYIPGLMIRDELRALGCPAQTYVFEQYIPVESQQKIGTTKSAYHSNFRLALTGQKLAQHFRPQAIKDAVWVVAEEWSQSHCTHCIVLSGYWMPIISEVAESAFGNSPQVRLCHIDSTESPSWKNYADAAYCHEWLVSGEERRLLYQIPVRGLAASGYSSRSTRVVVHGGGWGLGDYRRILPELSLHGISADVIAYGPGDAEESPPGIVWHLLDCQWHPWVPDPTGEHSFPRLHRLQTHEGSQFPGSSQGYLVKNLICGARAIVSKPGGATLVDSIATETPIVFLDPYGDHEASNASVWQELGFGLTFRQWRDLKFSLAVLEEKHENLRRARERTPSYPKHIAQLNANEADCGPV